MLVVERCEGSARNRQTYVAQFGLLEYVQEDTYTIWDEPAREAQDRGKVARRGVWTVDRTDMGCRGCQRNIGHVDIGRERERGRG